MLNNALTTLFRVQACKASLWSFVLTSCRLSHAACSALPALYFGELQLVALHHLLDAFLDGVDRRLLENGELVAGLLGGVGHAATSLRVSTRSARSCALTVSVMVWQGMSMRRVTASAWSTQVGGCTP